MYLRSFALVVHILGFTMWIANLFVNFQTLTGWAAKKEQGHRSAFLELTKENVGVMNAGLVITLIGAGLLLGPNLNIYVTQPWLYIKLTLVAVLIGIHFYFVGRYKRASAGEEITIPAPLIIGIRMTFIGILFVILFKPFGH